MFDYGERLKAFRKILGYSQRELAEKSNIDEKYYGRIERKESVPTIEYIEKLCSGLEIPLVMFFMPSLKTIKDYKVDEFTIQKIKSVNFKDEIDIHYYCDVLRNNCHLCLWYNGYIASASFDEYELKLVAVGKIRASIYVNYQEVATINSEDAGDELFKYYKDDYELIKHLEREEFNQSVLEKHLGNVIFMPEANWLIFYLSNNVTGEILEETLLDTENIYKPFSNEKGDLIEFMLPKR